MTEKIEDFDLLAFVEGRSRAKDSVTLYTDEDSALAASKYLEYSKDGRAIGVLKGKEEEWKAAQETLKASAIEIHLEGTHEGVVEDLQKEHGVTPGGDRNSDEYEAYLVAVLDKQYQKTVRPNGAESTAPVTVEGWFKMKRALPKTQWLKLLGTVSNLIWVSATIDENADEGFLANS